MSSRDHDLTAGFALDQQGQFEVEYAERRLAGAIHDLLWRGYGITSAMVARVIADCEANQAHSRYQSYLRSVQPPVQ